MGAIAASVNRWRNSPFDNNLHSTRRSSSLWHDSGHMCWRMNLSAITRHEHQPSITAARDWFEALDQRAIGRVTAGGLPRYSASMVTIVTGGSTSRPRQTGREHRPRLAPGDRVSRRRGAASTPAAHGIVRTGHRRHARLLERHLQFFVSFDVLVRARFRTGSLQR